MLILFTNILHAGNISNSPELVQLLVIWFGIYFIVSEMSNTHHAQLITYNYVLSGMSTYYHLHEPLVESLTPASSLMFKLLLHVAIAR